MAQTVAQAVGVKPGDVAANAAADTVTGRFTRPEEVADLVLLLASDRTGNVTALTSRSMAASFKPCELSCKAAHQRLTAAVDPSEWRDSRPNLLVETSTPLSSRHCSTRRDSQWRLRSS
jgi:hypothetical protein